MDATRQGNETRFINDYRGVLRQRSSREPGLGVASQNVEMLPEICNCGMPVVVVRCTRAIANGEEFLNDYGENYWEDYGRGASCGSIAEHGLDFSGVGINSRRNMFAEY